MIREPSGDLAERTMEGEEYASLVTQVEWNVYVIRKKERKSTTALETCSPFDDGKKKLKSHTRVTTTTTMTTTTTFITICC